MEKITTLNRNQKYKLFLFQKLQGRLKPSLILAYKVLFLLLLLIGSNNLFSQTCPAIDYNNVANKMTITLSSQMPSGGGSLQALVDGSTANGYWHKRNNNVVGLEVFRFTFPSPEILLGVEMVGSRFLDGGVTVRVEGSNDATNWTDVSGTITMSGSATSPMFGAPSNSFPFPCTGNTSSYTYYRIYGLSGQTDWNWIDECYFQVGAPSVNLSNIGCTYGADNSTTSDDELTFNLNPLLPTSGGTYTVSSSFGTATPSNGTVGTTTFFTLSPGSVGAGDITITVTDVTAGCNLTEVIPNQTPVPWVDRDGDSIGDKDDLDADNDGIPNTVEDGYCVDEACDPDGDGLRNSYDLDSDGDGIPDNIEAQSTAGYVLPNADDIATYVANGGINTAYLGGLPIPDTELDGIPDFLDQESDGDHLTDAEESGLPGSGAGATYSDVNGIVNDPNTNLAHVTTTTSEADYRDKKPPTIVKVCYNSDQYSISGGQLTYADDKLLNLNNWGPDGVDNRYQFELFSFGTGAITEAALIANGCQIMYVGGTNSDAGNFNPGTTSALSASDKLAVLNWGASPNNVVISAQGYGAYFGGADYAGTSGNSNPNSLTPLGEVVISGLFGQTTSFNQGGGYQGKFTAFPSTACVITQDNNGNPTGLLDGVRGDFYFADFDMLSELGGLSNSNNITSNTDMLFANLFSSAAMVAIEGPTNACNAFLCPAGDVAPALTSNTISSAGLPVDLTSLYTGTPPTGTTVTWHTASPAADENYIGNPTSYTQPGTVYAAFRAEDGSCYSPATPVVVSIDYPDLEVTISPVTETSATGEVQTFTVTVTNNGPITAPDAVVKVPIPAERELILANPSMGVYSGSTNIWNIGQLTNGQSATLTITIRL